MNATSRALRIPLRGDGHALKDVYEDIRRSPAKDEGCGRQRGNLEPALGKDPVIEAEDRNFGAQDRRAVRAFIDDGSLEQSGVRYRGLSTALTADLRWSRLLHFGLE